MLHINNVIYMYVFHRRRQSAICRRNIDAWPLVSVTRTFCISSILFCSHVYFILFEYGFTEPFASGCSLNTVVFFPNIKFWSRHLGLQTVSIRCFGTNRKPKVSVSGLNVSYYKLIFNDRSSLKSVPVISVFLISTACHSRIILLFSRRQKRRNCE